MDFKNKLEKLIELHYGGNKASAVNKFAEKYDDIKLDTIKSWIYRGIIPKTTAAILLCDFFDCDFEYLFGNQKELRKPDMEITKRLGLSQKTILNIDKLTEEEKKIVELMFSDTEITQTRQLLNIIYTSSMYLANGINKISIDVDVLPDTSPEIQKSIHDYLKGDTEIKLFKLQAETAFYKLFDYISENRYFKDYCKEYLFNKIMQENENMKETIKSWGNVEIPPFPKTDKKGSD